MIGISLTEFLKDTEIVMVLGTFSMEVINLRWLQKDFLRSVRLCFILKLVVWK